LKPKWGGEKGFSAGRSKSKPPSWNDLEKIKPTEQSRRLYAEKTRVAVSSQARARRLVEVENRPADRRRAISALRAEGNGQAFGTFTDYTFAVWSGGEEAIPFAKRIRV